MTQLSKHISVQERKIASTEISVVDIYKGVYKAASLNSTEIEACGNITVSLPDNHSFLKYDSETFTLTMTGNKTTKLSVYEDTNF